jgi:hypothetical protein
VTPQDTHRSILTLAPSALLTYSKLMKNGELLQNALEGARPTLEAGLAAAEQELKALDSRRSELLTLIGQARAALGIAPPAALGVEPAEHRLTLHEAIAQVLREHGNQWMTVRDLATEINQRSLYRKKDGSPVEANQVHARTKNYATLFEKDGPRVRLRA